MKMYDVPHECPNCGELVHSGYKKFCSKECRYLWQSLTPSPKKGKTYPHLKKQRKPIPCRICGNPTRYFGNMHQAKMLRCESPKCIELSKKLKNQRISQTHSRQYDSGERSAARQKSCWGHVSRISYEEACLEPFFVKHGWIPQFKYVIGNSGYPRCFWLDFAKPELKLCVEVDGNSHRDRQDRDIRKDMILRDAGWQILRILAKDVGKDLPNVTETIEDWIVSVTSLTLR